MPCKRPVRDAARNQNIIPAGDFPRLNREFDTATIVIFKQLGAACLPYQMPCGCKRVGNDNFSPLPDVIHVDFPQDIGMAERAATIPGVGELGDTAAFNLGSCSAINHDGLMGGKACHKMLVTYHEKPLTHPENTANPTPGFEADEKRNPLILDFSYIHDGSVISLNRHRLRHHYCEKGALCHG